jgi:preprotein translocase subunit SecB
MADETPRNIQFLKVYLKDCSVESPNSPAIFSETGESQFKLDGDVTWRAVDGRRHDVVVTL